MDTPVKASVMDWTDSLVFIVMLCISLGIGIYFGCFGSKQKDPQEYLLGGKKMKAIPVALSIVATFISGTTLIAVPAEIYTEGCTYWLSTIANIFAIIVCYYCIIPIFFDANINSGFEYLELRYDRSVRSFSSCLYCLAYILILPIFIYIPSLTLSQATGINLYLISVGVISVCVFYTMIGGFKAVVWTDFFQLIMTVITSIAIVVIGTINAGGMSLVFKTAYDDGKLDIFNMDPNPFQRNTFWTIFVGSFTMSVIVIGINQACIQRYISLESKNDLPLVLTITAIGINLVVSFSVYSGLVVYTAYYGCDPIAQKIVSKPDQIFPHYMLDKVGYVPTLPGLFMAGVFSAALSTMSTVLNTIAATVYEDYIKTSNKYKDKAHLIMKSIIVIAGIISILLIFLIEQMGKIISAVYIITSFTTTPLVVIFVTGMTVPKSNKKGVMTGAITAMLFVLWIAIGSSMQKVNFVTKDVYPVNTCPVDEKSINQNSTIPFEKLLNSSDETFFLYRLSYMLYNTAGLVIGMIISYIVSYATGFEDPTKVDPNLISPPLRRFLPKQPIEIYNLEENLTNE